MSMMTFFTKMAEPMLGRLYPPAYHRARLTELLQERQALMVPVVHMHKAVRVTSGSPYVGLRVTRVVNRDGKVEANGAYYLKGRAEPGKTLVLTSWSSRRMTSWTLRGPMAIRA